MRQLKQVFLAATLVFSLVFSFFVSSLGAAPAQAATTPTKGVVKPATTQNTTSGTVVSKGSNQFTLSNSSSQLVINVNANTVYGRYGQTNPGFADIAVGMYLGVGYTDNGTGTL